MGHGLSFDCYHSVTTVGQELRSGATELLNTRGTAFRWFTEGRLLSSSTALKSWTVDDGYEARSPDQGGAKRLSVVAAIALMAGASLLLWAAIIAALSTLF